MLHQSFSREITSFVFKTGIIIAGILLLVFLSDLYLEEKNISDGSCNIAVLPIEGVIMPFAGFADYSLAITPTQVRDFIQSAEQDENIVGLMLEINSPGGTPVAAEQISQAVHQSKLPTASLIGDIGTSGAYLVAAGANTIFASAMSDVGSIGVTMSYVEESKKNEDEGLTFVPLASGKYKDIGNPNKSLTDDERKLLESDLQLVHHEFVNSVAELRNKPVADIEKLADGSSMPGKRALEAGLIDNIGGRTEVKQYFAEKTGLTSEEIKFCDYL